MKVYPTFRLNPVNCRTFLYTFHEIYVYTSGHVPMHSQGMLSNQIADFNLGKETNPQNGRKATDNSSDQNPKTLMVSCKHSSLFCVHNMYAIPLACKTKTEGPLAPPIGLVTTPWSESYGRCCHHQDKQVLCYCAHHKEASNWTHTYNSLTRYTRNMHMCACECSNITITLSSFC